ncbi:hypothetical protein EF513_05000 [Rickettsiales endosymbiont of Stachyamoeba lipophora]|nr:hypothetical protein EF513_05000 [Rickettsiales endosymbiont of Stachyamoeba lipophora]
MGASPLMRRNCCPQLWPQIPPDVNILCWILLDDDLTQKALFIKGFWIILDFVRYEAGGGVAFIL